MSVNITVDQQIVTAALEGELDHHSVCSIREAIDETIETNMPSTLVLDFRDVSFMDSSGIGLVMGRYKALKPTGAKLYITNTSPQIGKVMKLAGLDRLAVIE